MAGETVHQARAVFLELGGEALKGEVARVLSALPLGRQELVEDLLEICCKEGIIKILGE